jgi:hypothetical protein
LFSFCRVLLTRRIGLCVFSVLLLRKGEPAFNFVRACIGDLRFSGVRFIRLFSLYPALWQGHILADFSCELEKVFHAPAVLGVGMLL